MSDDNKIVKLVPKTTESEPLPVYVNQTAVETLEAALAMVQSGMAVAVALVVVTNDGRITTSWSSHPSVAQLWHAASTLEMDLGDKVLASRKPV